MLRVKEQGHRSYKFQEKGANCLAKWHSLPCPWEAIINLSPPQEVWSQSNK